jgi:Family of unknown function (DUF6113)
VVIWIMRASEYLALVLLGAAAGIAGVFVHGWSVRLGGAALPVGALAALAGCAGLFVGSGLLMHGRSGVLVPVVAWALVTSLFTFWPRPEGDVVMPNDVVTYGYLFAGWIIAAMVIGFPWSYLATEPPLER